MPTAYQTSAIPRGRRRDTDNRASSRTPSESSQTLTKKVFKSSDEASSSRSEQTSSSASTVSPRTIPLDRSISQKQPMMQTPSTISLNSQRSASQTDNDGPMVIPQNRAPPEPFQPEISSATKQSSRDLLMPTSSKKSRPGSPTDTEKVPSMARASHVSSQSQTQSQNCPLAEPPKSVLSLQPKVEEATDGPTPTPTPSKNRAQDPMAVVGSVSKAAAQARAEPEPPKKEVSSAQVYEDGVTRMPGQSPLPGTPMMSPPLSPRLNHHGPPPMVYNPTMGPLGPQPNFGYPPIMQGPNHYYPNPYYSAPYPPPPEVAPQDETAGLDKPQSPTEDVRERLVQKLSSVLPDIHRLMKEYKETHGQLGTKDLKARKFEEEHDDQLRCAKIELDLTKREFEKVVNELVGKRAKLEREVATLRQMIVELQKAAGEREGLKNKVSALEVARKEMAESVDAVRLSKEELLTTKITLVKEVERLKSDLHGQNDTHNRRVQMITEQHNEQLAAKEQSHAHALSEQKAILSKAQLELASLIAKHTSQKKDLEAARSLQIEHKSNFEAKSKELEEVAARHMGEMEAMKQTHQQEIEASKRAHQEELEAIKHAHQNDLVRTVSDLESRAGKLVEDHGCKEKEWAQEMETLRSEMQVQKDEFDRELEDHNKTKQAHEEHEAKTNELVQSLSSWKTKHAELQREHESLDRVLQGLGYAEQSAKDDKFLSSGEKPSGEQLSEEKFPGAQLSEKQLDQEGGSSEEKPAEF